MPRTPQNTIAVATTALVCGLAPAHAGAQRSEPPGIRLLELMSADALECLFEPPLTAAESADTAAIRFRFRDVSVREGKAAGGDTAVDGEVGVIPTSRGIHFYEFSNPGDLSLVTVYAIPGPTERYVATLSRHLIADGLPQPTQHEGYCTPSADANAAEPPAAEDPDTTADGALSTGDAATSPPDDLSEAAPSG